MKEALSVALVGEPISTGKPDRDCTRTTTYDIKDSFLDFDYYIDCVCVRECVL